MQDKTFAALSKTIVPLSEDVNLAAKQNHIQDEGKCDLASCLWIIKYGRITVWVISQAGGLRSDSQIYIECIHIQILCLAFGA